MENKHEQARKNFEIIKESLHETSCDGLAEDLMTDIYMDCDVFYKNEIKVVDDYITSCEKTENKYDELVKDIKRYLYLQFSECGDETETEEIESLYRKLSKVGVSND